MGSVQTFHARMLCVLIIFTADPFPDQPPFCCHVFVGDSLGLIQVAYGRIYGNMGIGQWLAMPLKKMSFLPAATINCLQSLRQG